MATDIREDMRAFLASNLLGGEEIGFSDDLLLSGLLDSLGVMQCGVHRGAPRIKIPAPTW